MKKAMALMMMLATVVSLVLAGCDYDEEVALCRVEVQLGGKPNAATPFEPAPGIEVEITDATASTFISQTDADGVARFTVPAGLYSAMVSYTMWGEKDERYPNTTRYWRYVYNGNMADRVVSTDSLVNHINLTVTVVRQSRYRDN